MTSIYKLSIEYKRMLSEFSLRLVHFDFCNT